MACCLFGLRYAPKIFTSLADALEWCAATEGIQHIFRYMDDYAIVGPPNSPACLIDLETFMRLCEELGVPPPPAAEKKEDLSTVIVFLGIVIDTVSPFPECIQGNRALELG